MAKAKKPSAAALAARERVVLFCVASGTDWQHAGITGEAITATIVKGLVERDAAGGPALTAAGRAVLRMLVSTL
jgi:hypothetical protein